MQYLSQNKSADFAEGLFWELCYQHENKRFKIYLETKVVNKLLLKRKLQKKGPGKKF